MLEIYDDCFAYTDYNLEIKIPTKIPKENILAVERINEKTLLIRFKEYENGCSGEHSDIEEDAEGEDADYNRSYDGLGSGRFRDKQQSINLVDITLKSNGVGANKSNL